MAKQQKKTPARRAPRATEPRMYGDGKPSQPAETQQPAAERPAASPMSNRPVAPRTPAPRTPAARSAPRGAGSAVSYSRVDRITDYRYVIGDLRRLGIVAAGIMAALVVLGFIIR